MSEQKTLGPLFRPGAVVATPAALATMEEHGTNAEVLLRRHLKGDWGNLCKEDAQQNNNAVKQGHRILSSYHLHKEGEPTNEHDTIWIITEADRSYTTFLLPQDY